MKIVIDIPEKVYEVVKNDADRYIIVSSLRCGKTLLSEVLNSIRSGVPLPKGHGRLIDADKLIKSFDGECGWQDEINIINRAETVLKADVKELG